MKFIKENSRVIGSMIANHFGMIVFGLILSMAAHKNEIVFLAVSVFSALFYFVLLYTGIWETGAKDAIRVRGDRLTAMPLKGLWLGLIANALDFILAVIIFVTFFPYEAAAVPADWLVNTHVLSKDIEIILQAMYAGIRSYFMPNNPLSYFLLALPAPLVSGLGYYMGTREFSILARLGLKKTDDRK